jgi:hypothetical protein
VTQAQAATVASALITAGFLARVQESGNVWTVYASSPNGPVNVNTVKTFADNQGVSASVAEAILS